MGGVSNSAKAEEHFLKVKSNKDVAIKKSEDTPYIEAAVKKSGDDENITVSADETAAAGSSVLCKGTVNLNDTGRIDYAGGHFYEVALKNYFDGNSEPATGKLSYIEINGQKVKLSDITDTDNNYKKLSNIDGIGGDAYVDAYLGTQNGELYVGISVAADSNNVKITKDLTVNFVFAKEKTGSADNKTDSKTGEGEQSDDEDIPRADGQNKDEQASADGSTDAEDGAENKAEAVSDTDDTEKSTSIFSRVAARAVSLLSGEDETVLPTISAQPQDVNIVLPWPKSSQSMRATVKNVKVNNKNKYKFSYQWYRNTRNSYEGAEKAEDGTYSSYSFSDKTTKTCEEYYFAEITCTPNDDSGTIVLKTDIAKFSITAPEKDTYGVVVGEDPIGKVYVSVVDEVSKRDDLLDGMGNKIEDIGPMKKAPVTLYEEPVYPSDDMMTVIARAIIANGGSQKGAASGYIESITNANGETRAEFSRGNGSGWMGTLNGWKTNMGFQNYSIANGELKAGDIIKVMYTTDLGNDIGLSDTNAEMTLNKLQVYSYYDRWATGDPETYGGVRLAETFDSDRHEYTALANAKELWVYTAAKNSGTRARIFCDGKEYSGSNTIPVENGMQVKVVLTNPSDSSGKQAEYVLNVVKEQTILHNKGKAALDMEYITKDGKSLGNDDAVTYVNHSSYYQFKSTAPGFEFDESKNPAGFAVTLNDLPENTTAKLEDTAGNSYDFVDGKATVNGDIAEYGTFNYYIKLQQGNIRESYLLIVTKARADFGVDKAEFIGGNIDFDSANIYNGKPEGTYFWIDENGKENGKTGYHAGVYDYNIYVNNKVTSVKTGTTSTFFEPIGFADYNEKWNTVLSVDGIEKPVYSDDLNKSWFSQRVRNAINGYNSKSGIPLSGEKTTVSLKITDTENAKKTITYNFNFIRVKTTPADVEALIEKLPAAGVVSYADNKDEIESVIAAYNELSKEEQVGISKSARDKLSALIEELAAQKETGEKLIAELVDVVDVYKDDIPATATELIEKLVTKYGVNIEKSEKLYNNLKGWALEKFQSENKEEYKVLTNAVKLLNLYKIKADMTTGVATDYADDFMTPTLAYNLNLGRPEDTYKLTFRDIIYSDAANRSADRRGEAGLPYNIPGRLKITVADEDIVGIKTVIGEYTDKGLGGGNTVFEDELYYMIPKKAGTTTLTVTLTDETGTYYGQIPEITVHVNSDGETNIENLSDKLTDINSRAYTRSNDTWYYWQGEEGAPFTFSVNGDNAKVTVKEYLGNKKTEYTPDEDGNVTVLLKDGYNSIEVNATYDGQQVSQVYGIKGKVIDYVISNKSRPGYELREGDTANIKITGISAPVHKILRIYNPASPAITYYTEDLPQQYVIRGSEGGMLSTSGYSVGTINVKLTASGEINLTNGTLYSSWYGSSTGSEGSQGNTGGIAEQPNGTFSVLPDLTFNVAENTDYETEALYAPEIVGGNTVKAGQKVTIKIPDLPTDELEETYPAVTYSYDANKFINAKTSFATNIPNATVESDMITNPNNGQSVSLSGLKILTFTVPANTPAGEYRIYGGSVALKQGDYVYTISKTVNLYERQIADLTINVEAADTAEVYEQTGKWITENVTDPTVGSIGGEWAVLELARSGYGVPADYYSNYVANVIKELKDNNGVLHAKKYTEYSRVILALTAIGEDVTDVGGYNLLENLSDYDNICWQGINGPIFALIALDSHDYEIPQVKDGGKQATRENLVQTILDSKLADGGWTLSGSKADADMTAMAVQALAPYYNDNADAKAAVDEALEVLSKMQNSDGSFSSAGAGTGANTESTSQVIVALTALGIDPATDSRFIKNGRSTLDALSTFAVDGGGFKHVADGSRDGMATEQGYYALAAYYRFAAGKTTLYDMSDVTLKSDKQKIKEVEELIAAINDPVTLEDKAAVNKTKTLYDSLGSELQAKIDAELSAKLIAALKSISELEIRNVEDLIDDIGRVTLDKEDKITKANAAYNSLTKEQQKEVGNYDILKTATETLVALKKASGDSGNSGSQSGDQQAGGNAGGASGTAISSTGATGTSKSATKSANVKLSSSETQAAKDVISEVSSYIKDKAGSLPEKAADYTDSQIDEIIGIYKAYMELSDEEKAAVESSSDYAAFAEILAKIADNWHYDEPTGTDVRNNTGDILPWYIRLTVKPCELSRSQEKSAMDALGENSEIFTMNDISFVNMLDGSAWHPENPVNVKLPMVDTGDYAHTVILHITDEGKIELISGEVSEGIISFDAASFSLYGIAGTDNDVLADDGAVIWPWIVIGIIALAAIGYIIYRRKKGHGEDDIDMAA